MVYVKMVNCFVLDFRNFNIHSKYFFRFCLAKLPRIIHHDQRINLEKFCDMLKMTSIVQQNCQIMEPVNREDLRTRLSCFGSNCKMATHFTRLTWKK